MSEDVFDKLQTGAEKKRAAEQARRELADANMEFVITIIPVMLPIAEDYVQRCRQNDIRAETKHNRQSIRFILTHGSGEERGLIGSANFDHQNRLTFEDLSPTALGKRRRTTAGIAYDKSNWSDAAYEALLQKIICDFVAFEDRAGKLVGDTL